MEDDGSLESARIDLDGHLEAKDSQAPIPLVAPATGRTPKCLLSVYIYIQLYIYICVIHVHSYIYIYICVCVFAQLTEKNPGDAYCFNCVRHTKQQDISSISFFAGPSISLCSQHGPQIVNPFFRRKAAVPCGPFLCSAVDRLSTAALS